MSTVTVLDEVVALRFTVGERIAGLLHDLDIPVRTVLSATVADDGLAAAKGLRAPGLGVPGRRKVGVWRTRGNRSLVAVDAHRPALVLELGGHYFHKVVVSDDHARLHADELSRRLHPSGGA